MGWMTDESGLTRGPANFVPLTPLSHLKRAADVHADRPALAYGDRVWTYAQYHARVSRLADALRGLGVAPGDVVATLLPNVPAQSEASFAVPACAGVLNTINTRLDADTVGYILDHGGARVVIVDSAGVPLVEAAIALMQTPAPVVIEVPDVVAGIPATGRYRLYEDLLAGGDPAFAWIMPQDEWESLALNYTSGTTGRPKGVVYHHRGAYLATMGNQIAWRMQLFPVMLQIVPLFHCNNWTHTWMMPLLGGCAVCCRDITAAAIYAAIADHGVTHFGGAPIVLNLIVNADAADRRPFDHTVEVFTAGAPPAAALLSAIGKLGFNITQVYGLTETYGPATECIWTPGWDALPEEERAAIKARQGVPMAMMEDIVVVDEAMRPVARDGATQGEIVMRGNAVMKGYYRNPEATAKAFAGGYFHSEDLAVQHPDGYIQITDRSKDIIISGGENISSIEVESALMHHAAVSLCAVVAMPDDRWGEVPCAFVELKAGREATAEELIAHTRSRLAGFKCPKRVVFGELPKTSTGKIQKFELRKRVATP
ncbi:fatty-acyl-CoA synthase [Loktanella atrilutea]|uniref:3-methylmercaptopropionyl-CoA ligase n=1 Tax=Loktanella atrilutea TaxID=366533 RepID=A0A1M5AXM6_LOKAT|nr:AMP-binding protein [Loktanella atrilutea]SHF34998.1 fatty-acyl-CoA synthase [Loktanella atrilutea]